MTRIRIADDYQAIRLRMEELHRERQRRYGGEPVADRPIRGSDAVTHLPRHIVRRYLAGARRSSSR